MTTSFISKSKFFSIIFITPFHILALAQSPNDPNSNQNPDRLLTSAAITLFSAAFILIYLVFYYSINYFFPSRTATHQPDPELIRPSWVAGRGLNADVLRSFPIFKFSEVSGLRKPGKDGPLECAVCLSVFEGDETLRLLPTCDHVFHVECVDTWLKDHSTCPYCRAELGCAPDGVLSGRVEEMEEGGMEVNEVGNDVVEEGQGSWKGGKLRRWNSTGHVARREREDGERFMLRLPEEVRNDIVTGKLTRSRSCIVQVTCVDVV